MAKKPKFDGPTGLLDPLTGRPVRQFTKSGHYYVRAAATRHFWGRVLDGAVFLAAFSVLSLLAVPVRKAMENSPSLWELAYDDGFFIFVLMLLWFPALYVYGMIWGKWGLFGDRAARMRSVRITDGTLSGPWIGGWRAVVWSFLPLYAAFMIASLFDGGVEHTPGYIPLDLESGVAKGRAPVPGPAIIAKEQAQPQAEAQARAQMPHLYGNGPDARS
ncbi:hypothetical protein ACX80E_03620 [Arthrobacter sp. TMN-49]